MEYPACQDTQKEFSKETSQALEPVQEASWTGWLGRTSSQGLTLQEVLQISTVPSVLWIPLHVSSFELMNLECVFFPPSQAFAQAVPLPGCPSSCYAPLTLPSSPSCGKPPSLGWVRLPLGRFPPWPQPIGFSEAGGLGLDPGCGVGLPARPTPAH